MHDILEADQLIVLHPDQLSLQVVPNLAVVDVFEHPVIAQLVAPEAGRTHLDVSAFGGALEIKDYPL